MLSDDAVAERALGWLRATHAAVCDVLEPWEHGTVARATRCPSYYDFNVVRVEYDAAMSVDELAAFADEALAAVAHRRVDFDDAAAAEPLRAGFAARGWLATRLLMMRHEGALPPGPDASVEKVPYDAVHVLRVAWHHEDFPGQDPAGYHEQAREVALRRNVRVLAVREDVGPVGFAQVERDGDAAEITQVFVHPEHRGRGHGTAITRAAIMAAGEVRDLWIGADDEDRAKDLYARLGFRPAYRGMQFLRLPDRARATPTG